MIKLTEEQRHKMLHAIGLTYKPFLQRKTLDDCFRNRYYTVTTDQDWSYLILNGLAEKRDGYEKKNAYFHVTKKGFELLKKLSDISTQIDNKETDKK